MNARTQDLIKELSAKHEKKPFWKGFHFLLTLWLVLNVSIFILEIATAESLVLGSSYFFFGLNLLGSLLSWGYFTLHLNKSSSAKSDFIFLAVLIALVITGLSADFFLNLISTSRTPLPFQPSDFRCFSHIIYSILPTAVLLPVFIKYFFVEKPFWTIGFLSTHVTLLGIAAMELKCHDRELWHLVLAHQSVYLPVFILFIAIFTLKKKLFS